MPMYNKGCDCWRLLSYLCLNFGTPALQAFNSSMPESFPIGFEALPYAAGFFLNTNSKVISCVDPISYYSLLAGLYVRSCISSTKPNVQIPAFPLISKTKTP